MRNTIISIFFIFALFAVVFLAAYIADMSSQPANYYDEFAKCLADKKVMMYGAAWCPHCLNEKKSFGDSFKYVPYTECPDNIQLCTDRGVRAFPTWILGDGRHLDGEQGLMKLSAETGCPILEYKAK